MAAVELAPSELTGIGVIDDQHQEIFDLISIFEQLAPSGDRERIGETLNLIVSHTLAHFEFEEELMEQADYPFLKVHKRLHDHFLQRLSAYTQRFDSGEDNAVELEQFLTKWLRSHFSHEDKDYSPQILAEMQGSNQQPQFSQHEGWLSRTLRKIA